MPLSTWRALPDAAITLPLDRTPRACGLGTLPPYPLPSSVAFPLHAAADTAQPTA